MKQLKITIAGKVKTFDLPENGGYKCEIIENYIPQKGEYKCEVTENYIPQKGDCVMVESKENDILYWCKVTDVITTFADFNVSDFTTTFVNFKISVNSSLEINKNGFLHINNNRIYTKITPEEVKVKYAEAGYDWDYHTDTIKPIKWMPKDGDEVWVLNYSLIPTKTVYYGDVMLYKKLLEKDLLFSTEEECQKLADYCCEFINNKK